MTDDPTLAVATDLGAIQTLHAGLRVQAWHKANARDMPGGLAMVALGPVANLAAIEGRRETLERLWWEDETGEVARPEYIDENDDPWEPPLQTLRWWTEEYRQRNGCEVERWTVATEAQWLIDNLAWVAANEPHFDDLARDMAAARRRLEDVLQDGEREERSWVPCLDCDETRDGRPLVVRLVRWYGPKETMDGWQCPRCDGRYDRTRFNRAMGEALRKHHEDDLAG